MPHNSIDRLEEITKNLILERKHCTYLIQCCQMWIDNDDLHDAFFEFERSLLDDIMTKTYARAIEINEQIEALNL